MTARAAARWGKNTPEQKAADYTCTRLNPANARVVLQALGLLPTVQAPKVKRARPPKPRTVQR